MCCPRSSTLLNISMSSINLESLTKRFPDKGPLIERMDQFLRAAEREQARTKRPKGFTVTRIFDEVLPKSQAELAQLLATLVEVGVLRKVIRLESEGLGPIQDFTSLEEVPPRIFDEHLNR